MPQSIFFFEPDTQQSTVRIPVRGYALTGLLIPSVGTEENLHVVRIENAHQAHELVQWKSDWEQRFGQQKKIILFEDGSTRGYWPALAHALGRRQSLVRASIIEAAQHRGVLRPFEWTMEVQGVLESLGIPRAQWYGFITPSKRFALEYRFDRHVSSHLLPQRMLVKRIRMVSAPQTLRAIQRLRDQGIDQMIEVTADGSVGGMGSVLVHPGTHTSQELLDLFRESGAGHAYTIVVHSANEQKWSLQYEIVGRTPQPLGMSEKWNTTTMDGRNIHYASMMGERLRSISSTHRLRAHRVCQKILQYEIQKGATGSMGFVWHSLVGQSTPELLYRTVRDESETVAHYILRWLKHTQQKEYVALHSRIFFKKLDWEGAKKQLGESLLFSAKKPYGIALHIPYYRDAREAKKGKQGVKTLLLIAVGKNTQAVRSLTATAIKKLHAWRQGQKN